MKRKSRRPARISKWVFPVVIGILALARYAQPQRLSGSRVTVVGNQAVPGYEESNPGFEHPNTNQA